jgi:hypothetical protein
VPAMTASTTMWHPMKARRSIAKGLLQAGLNGRTLYGVTPGVTGATGAANRRERSSPF